MPLTLTDRQVQRIAAALRRAVLDSYRIADAFDPAGRTHFLIEVHDMGQFAKDWEQLKALIGQKDDALANAAAELASLRQQVAAQAAQFDDADRAAIADIHQVVLNNPATPPDAGGAVLDPTATAPSSTPSVPAPASSTPATPAIQSTSSTAPALQGAASGGPPQGSTSGGPPQGTASTAAAAPATPPLTTFSK